MGIQNARGTGMANRAPYIRQRPYRWHGIPGWNPAASLPAKPPRPVDRSHQEKLARMARFAKFRKDGMNITEASKAVGVHRETGRQYERELRARGAS